MNPNIKEVVRAKYNQIARQEKGFNEASCCGATGCCDTVDYTIFSDDYSAMEGYEPDADLGLGCGIPTQYAGIETGDTVIDLGSGAGNDAFVARALTGDTGQVIGLDFAGAMLTKAKANANKLGFSNVKFVKGDIEEMPFEQDIADVILSNCVLNLVPDKGKAFSEIYRVLKPGGHFCISDVVLQGSLPEPILKSAEMYAGCVAGASQMEEYLNIISECGFKDILILKQKKIQIPEEILLQFINADELAQLNASGAGVFSITVQGRK